MSPGAAARIMHGFCRSGAGPRPSPTHGSATATITALASPSLPRATPCDRTSTSRAWWSPETAGIIGGIGGAGIGLLGALIGGLASRQRARGFVIGTLKAGAVVGVALLGLGIVAVTTGQPYEVWFLLLLTGIILAAVFGGLIGQVTARYEATELHRIRAHDLV